MIQLQPFQRLQFQVLLELSESLEKKLLKFALKFSIEIKNPYQKNTSIKIHVMQHIVN